MSDLNQFTCTGRLGKPPEVKYTQKGTAICNMSIACGRTWMDKSTGQKQEETEWINVTVFGNQAEVCGAHLNKGSQVLVVGEFRTEKYEKDGQTRYSTKIIANKVQFLGSRNDSGQSAKPVDSGSAQSADFNDSIPF